MTGARWTLAVGVCAALLVGCGPKRRIVASGPYVQDVTSSSAVLAVVTRAPDRLRARVGVPPALMSRSVIEEEPSLVHGIRVDGLTAGTTYAYRLETLGGTSLGSGTFRTAPPATEQRCVFLVVGDSGGTDTSRGALVDGARAKLDDLRGADLENQQALVVSAMLSRSPDLLLHTGDVVYPDGAREDYPAGFFAPFAPLIANVPMYPTLGNHDLKSQGGAPFLETFFLPRNGPRQDERTYSFNWGPVHFVCLDVVSAPLSQGDRQTQWLERDLAATDRGWKVVYFHVPPFSPVRQDNEPIKRVILPVLEAARVDLVLSGHDHAYARFFPVRGVTHVVTGGGGKSLYQVVETPNLAYAESVFHFVEGEVEGRRLTLRAIDTTGRVFDTVTILK